MPERETMQMRQQAARATFRALLRSGEDLLARSQQLAPIEEGTLRASAELAFIVNGRRYEGRAAAAGAELLVAELAGRGDLRTLDVEVSFNTIYAARQHEERDWHHPLGGQADYLGAPLRANLGRYMRAAELEHDAAIRGAR